MRSIRATPHADRSRSTMSSERAVLFAWILAAAVAGHLPHPLSDEFIQLINAGQSTWTAGRNFPEHTSMKYLKNLMGLLRHEDPVPLPMMQYSADVIESLPDHFDPREKWTNCPSLNEIRDQGNCGSCWAHGAVEAMTDRVCIHSNGTQQFHFSAEDMVTCCSMSNGCHGGSIEHAWSYYETNGLVSGGNYNSSEGCKPYRIPPCEHFMNGTRKPCGDYCDTPACEKSCDGNYPVEYKNDLHFGKKAYSLYAEEDIQAELFENGPVEAAFDVYEDFLSYKSGVYQHTHGDVVGRHAIKILGYGMENGVKYWLCANSWNTDWGDNGFFKFIRGKDDCGILEEVVTALPIL